MAEGEEDGKRRESGREEKDENELPQKPLKLVAGEWSPWSTKPHCA